jgi:septum site-determining protein MinD
MVDNEGTFSALLAAPAIHRGFISKVMTRVIVVTSGKGGVGKTTSTANLGMALAQIGRRVVVIDADFGLRNLDLLLGLENRIVYTAQDVLTGHCRLEQALVKDKRQPNLALLPAANNRLKESVSREQMEQLVSLLEGICDYMLIDSPAGIETGFQNAIAAAREALIVTTPEIAAVRDADRVIGLLEAQGVTEIRLIVNRLRPAMVKANDMMSVADVQEILAIPLIGIVPDDEQVIVSTNRGEPLVLLDPPGLAGSAFANIARRLEGEERAFLDLEVPDQGFLKRLRRLLAKKIL